MSIFITKKAKYKVLDYIESTGTQWIDTLLIPTSNTRVVIDVETTDTMCYDANIFTATWNGSGFAFIVGSQSSGKFYWYNGGGIAVNNFNTNTRYLFNVYQKTVYVNGEKIIDNSYSTLTYQDGIKLFGFPNGTHMNKVKIYSCKIYENEALKGDIIPIIDENGIACLYDKVRNKKLVNKGTGLFVVGNETGEVIDTIAHNKIYKMYIGSENGKAKRIKYTYCSASEKATVSFRNEPRIGTYVTRSLVYCRPNTAGTKNHIVVAGGMQSNNSTVNSSGSEAFNITGVRQVITSLSPSVNRAGALTFNGNAVFCSGASASSASSRTTNVQYYDNNLQLHQAPTMATSKYDIPTASNSTHFIVAGGCAYYSDSVTVESYSSSFVKTNLTNLSATKRGTEGASVGNYLVFHSGSTESCAYDNNNVKKSLGTSDATGYSSACNNEKYAYFNKSGSTTVYIFDSNLTKTSMTLYKSLSNTIAFSSNDNAILGCGSGNTELFLIDTNCIQYGIIKPTVSVANHECRYSGFGNNLGMISAEPLGQIIEF